MNQLVFIENNRPVTDSLTVADAFGKEHKRVLQDIRELGCSEEFGKHNFVPSSYQSSQNKQIPKFLITEQGFALLVMGYTGPKAMEFKEKYIVEFDRMREQLKQLSIPSYMIDDPIKRAEKWIEEQRAKQALETEKLMLEQRVAEYEPKVMYVDQILKSTGTVTATQIAKDYGMSGQELNNILHAQGVQYKINDQWLLYSEHQHFGYTQSRTHDYVRTSGDRGSKMHTRWTQKGRLFIHEILTRLGFVPNIERVHEREA